LRKAIDDKFDEYLPSNPALRVATQVGMRVPGYLALFAGQVSYATELSDKLMLAVVVGAALGLPTNGEQEGGYQGPSGNIIESIKYKERLTLLEAGPELRYGASKGIRLSLQGLFRHSFITWSAGGDDPELSYGSNGVLARAGVDVLLWGPLFVGAASARSESRRPQLAA